MNKTAFLGWVLLGGISCFAAGCSSSTKNNTTGSGGQSNTGGSTSNSTSTGGSTTTTTSTGGGSSLPPLCEAGDAGPQHAADGDGGLILSQVGETDPSKSIALDVGGYFTSGDAQGYCFTYADNKPNGSTIFPLCGTNGDECFTKSTGLCVTASLGVASSAIWGAGIGCALSQQQSGNDSGKSVSVASKTSISVEVYGCKVPKTMRVQLNIYPPIYEADKDLLHSGFYCKDVYFSDPDANGVRKGNVDIAQLREDCWTGTGLLLATATLTAKSIQIQVNSDGTNRTDWDFCVSKLSVD